MSENNSARTKLIRLADALIDDIMITPVENTESDKKDIERARAIFDLVKVKFSKMLLDKAKYEFEVWRAAVNNIASIDNVVSKEIFEKIRKGNPEFDRKIMIAARNGETPSEDDIAGLTNDFVDLQRLDEDGEKK